MQRTKPDISAKTKLKTILEKQGDAEQIIQIICDDKVIYKGQVYEFWNKTGNAKIKNKVVDNFIFENNVLIFTLT